MPKAKGKKRLRCRTLVSAVSNGSMYETKRLLCQGNHPDKDKNTNGHTPIFIAALLGNNDIFQLLLSYKASIEVKDTFGNSMLHVTCNTETVKSLLSVGLDVNGRNQLGRTPLQCAIMHRNFDVADILIGNGSDVNARDIDGNTCLHLISKCYHNLTMQLLEHNVGDYDISSVYDRNYVIPMVKKQQTGGFHLALLEHDKDLFDYINYIIKVVKTLDTGDGILEVLEHNPEFCYIAEKLIANGADATLHNLLGQIPLHLAVNGSNYDLIKLLCKAAPSAVNMQDNIGQTPLIHCYTYTDNYEHEEEEEVKRKQSILSLLHEHRADINSTDVNGFGILYYASESLDSLKDIAKLDPDVDVRSCTGASILHLLASETEVPDVEMLELLLQMGLNINCRDNFGATPLFYASWTCNTEWIELLLKHGCRLDALDHFKHTASDLTMFNKRDDIADILKGNVTGDDSKATSSSISEGKISLCLERNNDVDTKFESMVLPVEKSIYISDLLESPVTGRTDSDEENLKIKQAVLHLITKMGELFETFDPRFKMRMELSGSVSEGAKCGRADEFDFLCFLENFEPLFQPE